MFGVLTDFYTFYTATFSIGIVILRSSFLLFFILFLIDIFKTVVFLSTFIVLSNVGKNDLMKGLKIKINKLNHE